MVLLVCLAGSAPCGLAACANGRATLDQRNPIQVQGPRKPWLFCVGESESRCDDDLGLELRRSESDRDACGFSFLLVTIASGELAGQ